MIRASKTALMNDYDEDIKKDADILIKLIKTDHNDIESIHNIITKSYPKFKQDPKTLPESKADAIKLFAGFIYRTAKEYAEDDKQYSE